MRQLIKSMFNPAIRSPSMRSSWRFLSYGRFRRVGVEAAVIAPAIIAERHDADQDRADAHDGDTKTEVRQLVDPDAGDEERGRQRNDPGEQEHPPAGEQHIAVVPNAGNAG